MSGSVSLINGHIDPDSSRMTDKEIIKALECFTTEKCWECPFEPQNSSKGTCGCCEELIQNAADLINNQQADNQKLKGHLEQLKSRYDNAKTEIERLQMKTKYFSDIGKMYSEIRSEAVKELEKKFENKINEINFPEYAVVEKMLVICKKIMNEIVKEMVGD